MKKLMMFAAVMAAGCVPNNTIFAPEDAPPEMEPDGDPDPDPDPAPCEPGFIGCEGDIAQTCGSDGVTVTDQECEAGCNADAERCNECAPDTAACAGNELEMCGIDGLVSSSTSCTMGCVPGDSPHCEHIVPAFLPNVCDVPASEPTFVVPAGQENTLDTANAANCNGGIVAQAGGPEVCVVRYGTISIDGPLKVVGNRAIAFVADGPLDVDNIIDVSARGRDSGPGGGFRTTGTAPTLAGGGGAGGKQAGASGGNGGEFDSGGPGGAIFDPLATQSFQGGAKAGSALQMLGNNRPRGGGGGGALMLISCTSKLSVTGTIEAGGGGGGAGVDGFSSSAISLFGGAGGGAGGYVVLQGATVTVSGQLFANGGGGGGGCSTANCVGVNGEDAGQIRARGGAGIGLGGAGGGGGFSSTTPASGSAGTSPGGGGGSTGRFQIFTPTGVLPSTTGAVAQPAFEPHRQISTR